MSLRDDIAKAIVETFEKQYQNTEEVTKEADHNEDNYNPDTCYKAADEVVKVLLNKLTGQLANQSGKSHDGVFVLGNQRLF